MLGSNGGTLQHHANDCHLGWGNRPANDHFLGHVPNEYRLQLRILSNTRSGSLSTAGGWHFADGFARPLRYSPLGAYQNTCGKWLNPVYMAMVEWSSFKEAPMKQLGVLRAFVSMLGTVLVATSMVGPSPAHGQDARRIPMSGVVLDATRAPVANADVALIRHAGRSPSHRPTHSSETLARGTTDTAGKFSFGLVALNTDFAFPLETHVSWEYEVLTKDGTRSVQSVAFTAPRNNAAVITSISAEIQIR